MSDDLIPKQVLMLVTLAVGLICIYLSDIAIVGGVLSIVTAVLAGVWATNSLRHVAKYSLGTGVPSIIYMLTAVSLSGYILGMILSIYLNNKLLFPIASMLIACIFSWLLSLICKHILNIRVEILSKAFMSISLSAVMLLVSMSTLITKTYDPTIIYESVIQNAMIILLMIMSVMVIQNPYNSCMGPNEEQYRTLSLSIANTFIMLVIVSLVSLLTNEYWMIYMIISLVGWSISFRQYVIYTKRQAASVKRFGLWPSGDAEE